MIENRIFLVSLWRIEMRQLKKEEKKKMELKLVCRNVYDTRYTRKARIDVYTHVCVRDVRTYVRDSINKV